MPLAVTSRAKYDKNRKSTRQVVAQRLATNDPIVRGSILAARLETVGLILLSVGWLEARYLLKLPFLGHSAE